MTDRNAIPTSAMPPPAALRLEYTCTREELAHADSLTRSPLRTLIVFAVMMGALASVFFTQVAPGERLLWGAVFGTIWVVTFLAMRRNPRPQPTRLLILSDSIRVILPRLDRQFEPADLAPLLESDTLFLLRNRQHTISIPIPKRAFPDADSQQTLRNLLASARQ
jgi:hypothetical protein